MYILVQTSIKKESDMLIDTICMNTLAMILTPRSPRRGHFDLKKKFFCIHNINR